MTKKDDPRSSCIPGIPISQMTGLVKLGLFFDPNIYKSVFGMDVSIPSRVPLFQSDLKTFAADNKAVFWVDPSFTFSHVKEKFQIKVPHSCPRAFENDIFGSIEHELSLQNEGYWCVSEKNPAYTYMSEHNHREHAKKENLSLPSLSERLLLELLSLSTKNGNGAGVFVRCSSHVKIGKNTMNVGIKREGKNIFLAPFSKFQTTQHLGSAFVSRIV